MKKIIIYCFLLISTITYSQLDGRFGIKVGATNYITDTNLLFSKSGIGLTIGLLGTVEFNESFELFTEINYNRHTVKLIGRSEPLAIPEDLKFTLENFSVPFLLNYSFFKKDDFKLGVLVGPSFHFIYEYSIKDSKSEYILDPLNATTDDLLFDSRNEKLSFNIFAAVGISAQYTEKYMVNLRYYYGITDPYRKAPVFSRISDIKGQDSYFSITATYFF